MTFSRTARSVILAAAITALAALPAAADPDMGETVNDPTPACTFKGHGGPEDCADLERVTRIPLTDGRRIGYVMWRYGHIWICEEDAQGSNHYDCKVVGGHPQVTATSPAPATFAVTWQPTTCVAEGSCVVAGYVVEIGGAALGEGTYEVVRSSPVLSPQTYSHTFTGLSVPPGGKAFTAHLIVYYGSLGSSGHVFCSWDEVTVRPAG